MLSFALLLMLASANFDRSAVKRALQNTQNDCTFRVYQIRFRLGELTALPQTL